MTVMVLMWSRANGVGKGFVNDTIAELMGSMFRAVKQSQLEGQFTDYLVDTLVCAFNELSGHDSRSKADELKDLITAKTYTINQKNKPAYVVPACSNFIGNSNHQNAIHIDGTHERRYFVHNADVAPLDADFCEGYANFMRSGVGKSALMHHLLNDVSLAGFNPMAAPPKTTAMLGMVVADRGELQHFLVEVFPHQGAFERDLFTAAEITHIFNSHPNTVKRLGAQIVGRELALTYPRFNDGKTLRVGGLTGHYYIRRHKEKWLGATPQEAATHIESNLLTEHGILKLVR